jgi:DNA-binding transcriptional LysR family regulator
MTTNKLEIPEVVPQTGLELRHLRAFVAVVEELNFTRAAARLNMTQPALSRTIAQMERMLDRQLIRRTHHVVEITEAGTLFLPHCRRTLLAIAEGIQTLKEEKVILRVGFTWGSASQHIGPIVRAFEKTHPQVEVRLRRVDQTLAGLVDGRSHLGFLPGQSTDPNVESLVLREDARIVALPVDHPLASSRSLLLQDLVEEPIVINVISGTTSLDLWPIGQRPGQIVRVRNVDEWLEAVAVGRGVGLTAASTGLMYTHPQITYRHVLDAPPVPITLVWRAAETYPLVSAFVNTARSLIPGNTTDSLAGKREPLALQQ